MGLRQGTLENMAVTAARQADFWRGKRVLVTGHSGFKGSWLALALHRSGANVTGISLPPLTTPSLFTEAKIADLCRSHLSDIRDAAGVAGLIRAARPEVVFHLAAQPLVRESYRDPLTTFETNVMGTVHVLEALRGLDGVRVAVMVTTDKVYRTAEIPGSHREDDPLGGHDPYSASKAASEMVIESYRQSYLAEQPVAVASARAGNVIGGGDWSEDRLIPDAVRAWQAGRVLRVRRPDAVRPWQHVLEPVSGYLVLAQRLWEQPSLAGAYNFGPELREAVKVRDLVELACAAYGDGAVDYGDGSEGPHESEWLVLDAGKAESLLGLSQRWTLIEGVKRTMAWYRARQNGKDARALCLADMSDFEGRAMGPAPARAKASG
ncbi:MAG TPA: CDP-glucose 4,6-dehydratase [Pseudolabrys sp.]|nr:CDP-glucose 4,6-dehydratase [Pseudolabrys sp.]